MCCCAVIEQVKTLVVETSVRRDLFSNNNLSEVRRRHKLDDNGWMVALVNATKALEKPIESLQKETAMLFKMNNARENETEAQAGV